MSVEKVKKIIIVGGGSSGWMTAAAAAKLLDTNFCEVQVIESDKIGTVGVGEATIPQIVLFNKLIGLDEDEFLKRTKGTFKLGIEFKDWGGLNQSYFHGFGGLGRDMDGEHFHQYWLRLRDLGKESPVDDYSLSGVAYRENKFMRAFDAGDSPLSGIAHAFHFDAGLYAQYLSEFAQKRGVIRTEGTINKVNQHENGFIKSVVTEDGVEHEADLFIDCSGFRGLLIEETLNTGFEDWSHYLPCDTAVTVPSENVVDPYPYTRSSAQKAGWQWRIPLQHRVGNGHVFCSKFMSEDEATSILLDNLDGPVIGNPRKINFVTGKRKKVWNKNCIAVGLASGFMEPLESTSLHLVQTTISRIFSFFPNKNFDQVDIDEFNRQSDIELERIRDFIILHYHVTNRNDTDFWNYCRTMEVPDSLTQKIEQYKANGRIYRYETELFNENSWFEVMNGQGLRPRGYSPLVDVYSEEKLLSRLNSIKKVIRTSADYMPQHIEYINKYCKS
ncbi:MAG: tryptophan halogenase [Flavobacteriales bacterium]|jgi:tryptophan halogenase